MGEWTTTTGMGETVVYDTPMQATCTNRTCPAGGIPVPIPEHVDVAFCGGCGQSQEITGEG